MKIEHEFPCGCRVELDVRVQMTGGGFIGTPIVSAGQDRHDINYCDDHAFYDGDRSDNISKLYDSQLELNMIRDAQHEIACRGDEWCRCRVVLANQVLSRIS